MNELLFIWIMIFLGVISILFVLPALIMMYKLGPLPRLKPPPGYYYDEKWKLHKMPNEKEVNDE